jgi:hypothetical protein
MPSLFSLLPISYPWVPDRSAGAGDASAKRKPGGSTFDNAPEASKHARNQTPGDLQMHHVIRAANAKPAPALSTQ